MKGVYPGRSLARGRIPVSCVPGRGRKELPSEMSVLSELISWVKKIRREVPSTSRRQVSNPQTGPKGEAR